MGPRSALDHAATIRAYPRTWSCSPTRRKSSCGKSCGWSTASPAHDTFSRVFRLLDPQAFEQTDVADRRDVPTDTSDRGGQQAPTTALEAEGLRLPSWGEQFQSSFRPHRYWTKVQLQFGLKQN